MFKISDKTRNVYKGNSQKYNAYVVTEDNIKIKEDLSEVKVEYIAGSGLIGKTGMRILSFKCFNSSKYNLTNKEITLYIEIEDPNTEEKESFKIGKFKIIDTTEKDIKKDEVSVKAKDIFYTLNVNKELKEGFPYTVKTLIDKFVEMSNINVSYLDIANKEYIVQKQFYYKDNYLIELLKQILETTATNGIINNENKIEFKKVKRDIDFILNDSDILELKVSDITSENYNTVVASRIKDNAGNTTEDIYYSLPGTKESERKEYKIIENYLIDENRSGALPEIINNIKGVIYKGVEITIKLAPFLEQFDFIEVKGKEPCIFYINDMVHDLKGGVTKIKCEVKTKEKTDFKRATTSERISNAEIKVDKIKGEISSFTEKISNSERLATNAQQTVLGIINKVEAQKENEEKRYTEIKQKVDSVTTSIQTSGTDNIIQDSVMYGLRKGQKISPVWEVTKFDKDKSKILSIIPDTETVSRCGFELVNSKIKQKLEVMANNVKNDIKYTLTVKLQKISMLGRFELKIYNINKEGQEENVRNIIIEVGENTEYKEYKIENIQFNNNIAYIELIATNSNISVTDLMLNQGIAGVWTQANGETRNSNVTIGIEGINLSNESTGDRLEITSAKITGYSKAEGTETEIFKVSGEDTIIKNAKIGSFIEMPPFTVISLGKDGEGDSGWAWIINERS